MTPEAAAWVRTVVLARQKHLATLVDACACQWGLTGHCEKGSHKDCKQHGRTPGYPRPSPETYLTDRQGLVLALVWRVGTPCMWRCPCEVCASIPALPGFEVAGERANRHGLEIPGRRPAPADEQLSLLDLAGAA